MQLHFSQFFFSYKSLKDNDSLDNFIAKKLLWYIFNTWSFKIETVSALFFTSAAPEALTGTLSASEDIGEGLPLARSLLHHLLQVQGPQLLSVLLLGNSGRLQGACKVAERKRASDLQ